MSYIFSFLLPLTLILPCVDLSKITDFVLPLLESYRLCFFGRPSCTRILKKGSFPKKSRVRILIHSKR
ncbi:hypothetical protein HMPREF1869_01391 [Bacteroidales bacterium KA00251]|nr:hypothetical protein HMPREF1869_01391 [Bacteroidales bacterium KA00251]